MAGLVITANGKRVDWAARPREHVRLPHRGAAGRNGAGNQLPVSGAAWIRNEVAYPPTFADVTWNSVLLYPAGYFSRRYPIRYRHRLPEGWKFATALEVESQDGNLVHFKATSLNTLSRLAALCRRQLQAF